jgi:tetratricopeptide (TPR) repeat protein
VSKHGVKFTPEENAKAVPLLLEAVGLDPNFGRAHAALALVYTRGCAWRWNEPLDMSTGEAYAKATNSLRMAEDRQSPLANVAGAKLYLYAGLHEEGVAAAARAVALDPNDPEAHLVMAWAMITSGRPADAIISVKTAMRLNPRYAGHYPLALGVAHYALGQFETAAQVLEKALVRNPEARELVPLLAAAQLRQRKRLEARATLEGWMPEVNEFAAKGFLMDYKLPYEWAAEHSRTKDSIMGAVEIAAMPPDVTVETLAMILRNGDAVYKRITAARKLGYFGLVGKDTVPALVEALEDENRSVRKEAIIALGKMGPVAQAAVPAIEKLLEDSRLDYQAKKALKKITGK